MQFLTNEFHTTFPKNAHLSPAIGNNDSYGEDYYSKPEGDFYSDMANLWSFFLMSAANRASFLQTFPPYAGYYEIMPPGSS